MHRGIKTLLGAALFAPGFLIVLTSPRSSVGEEPSSRLGRLFRFGGGASNSAPSNPANRAPSTPSTSTPAPLPSQMTDPAAGLVFSNAGATGSGAPANSGPTPRIRPQPRVSRASTEADPILSRIALVRSSDGHQFGMSMQVFADGTVIDNEGTHHLKPADLKPLMDLLESGDLYRLKGHCGAPATDFVEQVHMVVFERSLGRLRANAFSYSGNPQGCDHAVRHLHTVIEGLQAKLSQPIGPNAAPVAGSPAVPSAPLPLGTGAPEPPAGAGPTIELSPSN